MRHQATHNEFQYISQTLERFTRSFPDIERADEWLRQLALFGPIDWESVIDWDDLTQRTLGPPPVEPVFVRPWATDQKISIVMPTAHQCAAVLMWSMWKDIFDPPPVFGIGIENLKLDVPAYIETNRERLVSRARKSTEQVEYSEWLTLAARIAQERAQINPTSGSGGEAFVELYGNEFPASEKMANLMAEVCRQAASAKATTLFLVPNNLLIYDIPQRAIEDSSPPAAKRAGRPAAGTATIDQRMRTLIDENPEAKSWSARQFANKFDCSTSSIGECKTWKELTGINAVARAESEIKNARKRHG